MLTRYDRLEVALESRGISFHYLWHTRGIISQYTYRKIRRDDDLTDVEIAAIASGAGWSVSYVKSLID